LLVLFQYSIVVIFLDTVRYYLGEPDTGIGSLVNF